MARIPNEEIERLKNEVSVERLVEASGIVLSRSGKDWLGKCPFHADDTASLVVSPAKNLWHCFGCGVGGGPIDWVIKKDGVSFRHAVERLREGIVIASSGSAVVRHASVRVLASPVELNAGDQELLNQTIDYYHQQLKASPQALAYLRTRGLEHPEFVDRFRLGYADRTLGLRLPEKNRQAGADIRGRLQRIGLLRASGHEHFNGSLVVPIMDQSGNVTEVYGRKIRGDLRAGTPLHLYLPGPHRGVWNRQGLQGTREVILCEALLDAMSFWCAGFAAVTAAYGVEGFTEEMLAAFKEAGVVRVLIAYDRDEAGDRAAAKLTERLIGEGLECYRIQFPKGMDANDYACKVKPAHASLGLLIRKAVWLGKGTAPAAGPGQAIEQVINVAEASATAPAGEAPQSSMSIAIPSPATVTPSSLAAAVSPSSPAATTTPTDDDQLIVAYGEGEQGRRYRIRGLAKNLSYASLKVNVLAARTHVEHEASFVDTLDLYSARARAQFVVQAAKDLALREEVVKADLGRLLLRLEADQDARIKRALEPVVAAPVMSEAERAAALELLRAPDLLNRLAADFAAAGIVGERTNALVGYLAVISRLLDRPLGVVIQSSSAAGKTSLLDAVLAFVPEEARVKYSAVTGQALFYIGEQNLKHKVLALVEEEGASRASYALKLLQSEGELTIASTGKDPATGNLVTQEYRVEGPVALLVTTTARDLDEELLNRCLVLAVDEGRAQTRAIHARQRAKRTLEGLIAKRHREELVRLHQNAQRLLTSIEVLNPYAERLAFPDQATRLRRDHEKYLTLIDAIAFLHQYQRPVRTATRDGVTIQYIEVTLADIEAANAIAHEVLGQSLDELPPQTRRLLEAIEGYVAGRCTRETIERQALRFTRRALREAIGWGDTQLRLHLERLLELELVLAHRDGRGGRLVYELVYDGGGIDGRPFVPGLIEIAALRELDSLAAISTTPIVAGGTDKVAGSMRVPCGPDAGPLRSVDLPLSPSGDEDSDAPSEESAQTHLLPHVGNGKVRSYAHGPLRSSLAAASSAIEE